MHYHDAYDTNPTQMHSIGKYALKREELGVPKEASPLLSRKSTMGLQRQESIRKQKEVAKLESEIKTKVKKKLFGFF